jgi:DNA-binding HxlR family transcriptional regulator
MLEDKLISRRILSEIPPHTEYRLTARGQGFMKLLGALQKFSADWEAGDSA